MYLIIKKNQEFFILIFLIMLLFIFYTITRYYIKYLHKKSSEDITLKQKIFNHKEEFLNISKKSLKKVKQPFTSFLSEINKFSKKINVLGGLLRDVISTFSDINKDIKNVKF